jgi:hypothetical protein
MVRSRDCSVRPALLQLSGNVLLAFRFNTQRKRHLQFGSFAARQYFPYVADLRFLGVGIGH